MRAGFLSFRKPEQMSDERSGGIAGGIRTGIGLLTAFRDAVEETLEEAIARGDLSPERAKGVVREAAEVVQNTFEGARERFDVVSRAEYDVLRREVEELRARLDRLDGGAGNGPGTPTLIAPAAPTASAESVDAGESVQADGIPVD